VSASSPEEIDWLGARQPLPAGDYVVKVLAPRRQVDFVLCLPCVPIVSSRLAAVLRSIGDPCLQFLSVQVGGDIPCVAVNVHRHVECLDEARSMFTRWRPEDRRPDRLGEYRAVYKVILDPARIPSDAHMFRIAGWAPPVIVSEMLKEHIEASGATGPAFLEV